MAGEKTTTKRVVRRDEEQEPSIVLTHKQLQEIIGETLKTALASTPGLTEANKKEASINIQSTLATKINKRVKDGEQFFEFLADPNGPRKRIVIDKIYREFTGEKITSTVNGSTVKVPVDGKPHWVHPAHYAAIKSKLQYISAIRDRAAEGPDLFGNDVGDYLQVR